MHLRMFVNYSLIVLQMVHVQDTSLNHLEHYVLECGKHLYRYQGLF